MDATDSRYGSVTQEPDGRSRLEFRRTWPDDADDVWAALTHPDRSERWIGRYEGECAPGATGSFTMTAEEGSSAQRVTLVECVEQHRLVLDFPPEQGGWRLELDLVAQRGGTTLIFVQRLDDPASVADIAAGWHWYLDRLDGEISGTTGPQDWDAFLVEVGPHYRGTPS